MNVKQWGFFGALLGAAALAGCDESAMDEVQEKQEDVLEAEQELREEEAELRQAQQEAQLEGGGPVLTAPDEVVPPPALPSGTGQPTTTPNAGDPAGSPLPSKSAGGDFRSEPDDLPNEGNPDAGTAPEAAVEASDTAEPAAGGAGDLVPGSREP